MELKEVKIKIVELNRDITKYVSLKNSNLGIIPRYELFMNKPYLLFVDSLTGKTTSNMDLVSEVLIEGQEFTMLQGENAWEGINSLEEYVKRFFKEPFDLSITNGSLWLNVD